MYVAAVLIVSFATSQLLLSSFPNNYFHCTVLDYELGWQLLVVAMAISIDTMLAATKRSSYNHGVGSTPSHSRGRTTCKCIRIVVVVELTATEGETIESKRHLEIPVHSPGGMVLYSFV